MQSLAKTTDYKIQRLSKLLEIENGEAYFNSIVETFKFPNKDVETFLKTKTVQATKLSTATTYLVYTQRSTTEMDLVGCFSLAIKVLKLNKSLLSKSLQKIIKQIWVL